jgi:hypothetical protein
MFSFQRVRILRLELRMIWPALRDDGRPPQEYDFREMSLRAPVAVSLVADSTPDQTQIQASRSHSNSAEALRCGAGYPDIEDRYVSATCHTRFVYLPRFFAFFEREARGATLLIRTTLHTETGDPVTTESPVFFDYPRSSIRT